MLIQGEETEATRRFQKFACTCFELTVGGRSLGARAGIVSLMSFGCAARSVLVESNSKGETSSFWVD